jgi:hypothetical protein
MDGVMCFVDIGFVVFRKSGLKAHTIKGLKWP